MNDILFGNNNSEVITKLSKRYFKKNKVRNLAALLAIILTAFLFTSITSLAFNMASSIQLSLQMQKGSKADGTLGYMTEEQYEQLVNSDFVEQAGHRRIIGYASNTSSHSIEINYADSVQQELTFCVPTHGAAPEKANEIATTDLALKALGVEPKIGAAVPLEFELRGKTYHYDMVLSGWWEASNDSVSVATVSEQFIKENPDVVQNTYAVDHEMSGVTFSDVVLKNKENVQQQLNEFVYSIGGNPEDMGADNFILASENQMSQGLTSSESIVFAVGLGADDYLTKPFRIAELRARVNAHLRRERRERHTALTFDRIKIDLSEKELRVDNTPVALTKSEYLICEYLARNKGQVFSKEQIYEAVFSLEGDSDNSTISTHIKNIRSKLNKLDIQPIATVWGIGYKWE